LTGVDHITPTKHQHVLLSVASVAFVYRENGNDSELLWARACGFTLRYLVGSLLPSKHSPNTDARANKTLRLTCGSGRAG